MATTLEGNKERDFLIATIILGTLVGILLLALIATCVYFCDQTASNSKKDKNASKTKDKKAKATGNETFITLQQPHSRAELGFSTQHQNSSRPQPTVTSTEPQLVTRVNINEGLLQYPFTGAVTEWRRQEPSRTQQNRASSNPHQWRLPEHKSGGMAGIMPRTALFGVTSATNSEQWYHTTEGRVVLNAEEKQKTGNDDRGPESGNKKNTHPLHQAQRVILNAAALPVDIDKKDRTEMIVQYPIFSEPNYKTRTGGIYPSLVGF